MIKKCLAELIGTSALVFCGTGSIIINELYNGWITPLGIAITFGLIVAAMIIIFSNLSGAHINPAVTIAFGLSGELEKRLVFPYIISQLTGAIVSSFLLKILFPQSLHLGSTLPVSGVWKSFVLELILTYILMLVIYTAINNSATKILSAIMIGGTVLLESLFAGSFCGASMNPARSIAPAIISGNLTSLWIYILAPVIGASLATLTRYLFKKQIIILTNN